MARRPDALGQQGDHVRGVELDLRLTEGRLPLDNGGGRAKEETARLPGCPPDDRSAE
jgi:hypothetical protein